MVLRRSAGALIVFFGSARASAQDASADPAVPVSFRTETGATLRIQGQGLAKPGVCETACSLNLLPGNYVVYLESGGRMTPLDLAVRERSEVVVSPANPGQRGVGIGLIIAGGTVAAAGALAFYYDVNSKLNEERYADIDPSYEYSTPDWVLPTEIAGGIGLGVAIVGMVFLFTASPSLEVVPQRAAGAPHRNTAAERSRFQLVPLLGPQDRGVGVVSTF